MEISRFIELVDQAQAYVRGRVGPPHPFWTYAKIQTEIRNLIGGGAQLRQQLRYIQSELVIRFAGAGKPAIPYYTLVSYVFGIISSPPMSVDESDDVAWIHALVLIIENRDKLHLADPDTESLQRVNQREFALGHVAKRLMTRGLVVQISGRDVGLDLASQVKIAEEFDVLAHKIGGFDLLKLVIRDIHRTFPFNALMGQFLIGRRVQTSSEITEVQVPWGFLLHLGMKHLASSPKLPATGEYETLKSLASDAMATFDLQPYSPIEAIHIGDEDILSYQKKSAVYDAVFTVTQMKADHGRRIYTKLWTPAQIATLTIGEIRLSLLIRISDYILDKSAEHAIVTITASEIAKFLGCGIDRITRYLDAEVAHTTSGANPNLTYPPLATDVNYKERPLLKTPAGDYIILPTSMVSPLLAEMVFEFCCRADSKLRGDMGKAVEEFLRFELRNNGIQCKTGRYDYRETKADRTRKMSSDCDIVIESEKSIVFLECKNKLLSRRSRSGDDVELLVDMCRSFLHSQTQAMTHERHLKSHKTLALVDDGKQKHFIEFDDKEVERVSVSLWGFSSLQDTIFVAKFLRLCARKKFTYAQADASQSVEKENDAQTKLQELETKYLSPFRELSLHIDDFKVTNRAPFLNSRFLSVSNLLFLIDIAEDAESLVMELMRTKRTSHSTRDFASEYFYAIVRAFSAYESNMINYPFPLPRSMRRKPPLPH